MQEILGCLNFLDYVYNLFDFKYELELSTRPDERLGDDHIWDKAEAALADALN
jgi:threonyl-tRNA synthetase